MKFYIASRLENAIMVKHLAGVLRAIGWEQTYDWTAHGSVQGCGEDRLSEVARLETNGVIAANVVIVLLPGARGTHTELGIAIGYGKKIFMWGETEECFMQDGRTCSFYWHDNITQVRGSITNLVAEITVYWSDKLASG